MRIHKETAHSNVYYKCKKLSGKQLESHKTPNCDKCGKDFSDLKNLNKHTCVNIDDINLQKNPAKFNEKKRLYETQSLTMEPKEKLGKLDSYYEKTEKQKKVKCGEMFHNYYLLYKHIKKQHKSQRCTFQAGRKAL